MSCSNFELAAPFTDHDDQRGGSTNLSENSPSFPRECVVSMTLSTFAPPSHSWDGLSGCLPLFRAKTIVHRLRGGCDLDWVCYFGGDVGWREFSLGFQLAMVLRTVYLSFFFVVFSRAFFVHSLSSSSLSVPTSVWSSKRLLSLCFSLVLALVLEWSHDALAHAVDTQCSRLHRLGSHKGKRLFAVNF